jgi:hypothetical protein
MLPERYAYRHCKDNNWDIIVRWDGFDAQETSCNLNKIEHQGVAWLASFNCSGAGLSWLEDDEIRVSKNGWTLEAKISRHSYVQRIRRLNQDRSALSFGSDLVGTVFRGGIVYSITSSPCAMFLSCVLKSCTSPK